jgi:hypothetical protein
MKLLSKDFKNNEMLALIFTCDGPGISPQLEWQDYPKQTKSFALTCMDPDAPSGTFIHWIVYDIPANVHEIKRAGKSGKELKNDFGRQEYGAPCPPHGSHHYIFTIYALDVSELRIDRENFLDIFEEHKIDSAKLIGIYERNA